MTGSKKSSANPNSAANNYYKILGVRKNATPATIKKKYIEKVKAFPPESYPEEFQAIRKAYEVLRDPEKRSQYDLAITGVKSIDDFMEGITMSLEQRKWQEAKTIIYSARQQYPQEKHFTGMLGMACAGLGEIQEMQQCFDEVFNHLEDPQEKLALLDSYIAVMCLGGYYDDALHLIMNTEDKFAKDHFGWLELLVRAFLSCGRQDELIKLADARMPAKEATGIAAIKDLTDAISIIICMEQWNRLGKYTAHMRKLLKTVSKAGERSKVKKLFRERYKYYEGDRQFRGAAEFMDLICRLDPKDTKARQQLANIKTIALFSNISM